MKLLLTCSTMPEFGQDALDLWNKFCIAEWMLGPDLVTYLRFAPAAAAACIDAIVFLRPSRGMGFMPGPERHLWDIPEINPWEAPWANAYIAEQIRNLPESCAMRDGRKWKRIPLIVLTDRGFGFAHQVYLGLDTTFVYDVTELMLYEGYASPVTWHQIENAINMYHRKTLDEYARVGFLVTTDHGRYRVKRAFQKRTPGESDYYYGGRINADFADMSLSGAKQRA